MRFVRSASDVVQNFRELTIRSAVVKKMSEIHIDRNDQDLKNRPGVLKIHTYRRCASVASSLKAHVHDRVDALYPVEAHGREEGALLPGLLDVLEASPDHILEVGADTNFDNKQSTMHDQAPNVESSFEHVRPTLVVDEAESQNTFAPEVVAEHALKHIVDMHIQMSMQFEQQFISKYMPRILPWSLNCDCGGAEYPDLFTD